MKWIHNTAQLLNDRLKVLKSLIQLDEIFGKERYRGVYNKHKDLFHKAALDILRKGIDAVKAQNHQLVFSIMSDLERESKLGIIMSQRHLFELQATLNRELEEYINYTLKITRETLMEHMDIDKIHDIEDRLNKLEDVKLYFSGFINPEITVIAKKITRIKETISKGILDLIINIRVLLSSHNFVEFELKRKLLYQIRHILNTHCESHILERIKELEKTEEEGFRDLISKYSDLDIEQYFHNRPKEICNKLDLAKSNNPKYGTILQKIEANVVEKFQKEMEKAERFEPIDIPNFHLRALKSALNFLPDLLKVQLSMDLEDCEERIRQVLTDHENELAFISQERDPKRIKLFLEKCKDKERLCSVNKLRISIFEQVRILILKIRQSLDIEDILAIVSNIKILYDFKRNLGEHVDEINHYCSEIQNLLLKIFNEAYFSFKNNFLNLEVTITNEVNIATEHSFDTLLKFLKFDSKLDDNDILEDLFGCKKFETDYKIINDIISNFMISQSKGYDDALQANNYAAIKNIIDIMKERSLILIKISGYADKYRNSTRISTKDLLDRIKKSKSYDDMKKSTNARFQGLKEEFINEGLINNNTKKTEKIRHDYYSELSTTFSVLINVGDFKDHLIFDTQVFTDDCKDSLKKKIRGIFHASQIFLERDEYEKFNINYLNIVSFTNHIQTHKHEGREMIDQLDQLVKKKIQSFVYSFGDFENIGITSKQLIRMKLMSDCLFSFKTKINDRIDEVLVSFENRRKSKGLSKLGTTILIQDQQGIGQSIISEHKCFKGLYLSLFNQQTQHQKIKVTFSNSTAILCIVYTFLAFVLYFWF